MSQPSASPLRRPKKSIWRKPSLKSKQIKAQWIMTRNCSGSSQTATMNQELNSTLVLRSFSPLLSVQPRPTTPWSPYRTHQYPSSVPWILGGGPWTSPLAVQDPVPTPPQCASPPATGMQHLFQCLNVSIFLCFYILYYDINHVVLLLYKIIMFI